MAELSLASQSLASMKVRERPPSVLEMQGSECLDLSSLFSPDHLNAAVFLDSLLGQLV